MRIRSSLSQPLSWTAGAWVLAGAELILMFYLVMASPTVSRGPLTLVPVYGEMVKEVARTLILTNLMVILGLWVWVRDPVGEHHRARVRRLCGTAAAVTLVLISLAVVSLAQKSMRMTVQVDAAWQPSDSVVGSVYLSPPLPPIPPQ